MKDFKTLKILKYEDFPLQGNNHSWFILSDGTDSMDDLSLDDLKEIKCIIDIILKKEGGSK